MRFFALKGSDLLGGAIATAMFGRGSEILFADGTIDRIIVTDSVGSAARTAIDHPARLEVLSCAPLIAEAIKRLHANAPISDLVGMED